MRRGSVAGFARSDERVAHGKENDEDDANLLQSFAHGPPSEVAGNPQGGAGPPADPAASREFSADSGGEKSVTYLREGAAQTKFDASSMLPDPL